MTAVRYIQYENRLAKLIRMPGGKKIGEALAEANANLETIRESGVAQVDETFSALETLLGGVARPPTETLKDAYNRANEIGGMAGTWGLEAMGDAALSLCGLLDRLIEEGGWAPEAVAVHMHALRRLRTTSGAAAERAVIDGLQKVAASANVQGKPD